jgi:hypothetical protein
MATCVDETDRLHLELVVDRGGIADLFLWDLEDFANQPRNPFPDFPARQPPLPIRHNRSSAPHTSA